MTTATGAMVYQCPRAQVAPQVSAWIRAYNGGAGESSYAEQQHLSPSLVAACAVIRQTQAQIREAEIATAKRNAEQRHG